MSPRNVGNTLNLSLNLSRGPTPLIVGNISKILLIASTEQPHVMWGISTFTASGSAGPAPRVRGIRSFLNFGIGPSPRKWGILNYKNHPLIGASPTSVGNTSK